MYCASCGAKNDDDMSFCTHCGKKLIAVSSENLNETILESAVDVETEIETEIETEPQSEPEIENQGKEIDPYASPKKSKKPFYIIAAIVVLILLGVGAYLYTTVYKEKLATKKWEAFVEETKEWEEKKQAEKEKLILSDSENEEWDITIKRINNYLEDIEDKDYDAVESKKSSLEKQIKGIISRNKQEVEEKKTELEGLELTYITDEDIKSIETYKNTIAGFLEDDDYVSVQNCLDEWETIAVFASSDFDTYDVSVRQQDLLEYPKVKLYVDVNDANGNFVDNLEMGAFYVNEKRGVNGPVTRANIINAAKLNQNQGISIGLIADVSGSMYDYMDDAKYAMMTFVNSVQFDKGDEIELTEFAESSYQCQYFTNNASLLNQSIQNMNAYGQTRLYDTLLNEIARIQSQSNAKCIIGFTDGQDNVSFSTYEDVVVSAKTANIPVFLIGVGYDCDTGTLRYIAESTGGSYVNIRDISDLTDIYNQIYKEQKEVYCLEFEVSDENNLDDDYYTNIAIRTDDNNGGTVRDYVIRPMDFFMGLYGKYLVTGIDCQTKGERNMLDSGIIVTSEEAYKNKNCLAYQCQNAINTGGVGSKDSKTYEVLVDYKVEDVQKVGDGFVLYGMCNYDISKLKTYSKTKGKDREYIDMNYGRLPESLAFYIEDNVTDYEKLTLVKDADGKWKFNERTYENKYGGDAVVINEVYRAYAE